MPLPEQQKIEKAVLAGLCADVFAPEENATDETLDELEALLETAGGQCTAKVLQNRHTPDPHSFLGEGKVEEIKALLASTEATMLILDNDLSPSQNRALEQMTGVTVLDRSALILDIFAQRARTKEGRLQVELAQYQYLLPRLTGMWTHLERQEGAIGTRGPGETQLETDRRLIRKRIEKLTDDLRQVRQVRATQRERRIRNAVPVVALVGYTNAGKSTILNLLTGADIPANDRLFDTLDTTTRRLTVSDTTEVLLSDTVGFIAKLPHHLVEAFKATLEELEYADLLLHVIDCADHEREAHIAVVDRLIGQLAAPGTPVVRCYNKADLAAPDELPRESGAVILSAKTGEGVPALLRRIESELDRGLRRVRLLLPYDRGGLLDRLHTQAKVVSAEYGAEGIAVEAVVDRALYGRLRQYEREGA